MLVWFSYCFFLLLVKCIGVVVFVQLNRATVQNAVTGKLETASYRVSKT